MAGGFVHKFDDQQLFVKKRRTDEKAIFARATSLSQIKLNPAVKNIHDFCFKDFELVGGDHHPGHEGAGGDLIIRRRAMNCVSHSLLVAIWVVTGAAVAPTLLANDEPPNLVGWTTNGPAVFTKSRSLTTNQVTGFVASVTNLAFECYLPDSLNQFVWTNFIAQTNGRSPALWSENSHPPGWPTNAPSLIWNPSSLLRGMKGLTALSPCWEGEGYRGQVPITALTRRHGYTRGHGIAPEGVSTNWTGKKVWFVTEKNQRVEVTVGRASISLSHGDYTIFLFHEDLPPGIEPLRVVEFNELMARYPVCLDAPRPICQTEQLGQVNTGIAGFIVNAWKGGDSGSPDLLPLGKELVFYGGRSTAGPSAQMQADMDKLCVMEGLDPQAYQLQWVDLSRFPDYSKR